MEGAFVMIKKLLSLGFGLCCLLAFNQADAFEFDKKAIMNEFHCKSGDTIQYAYRNVADIITKEDRVFENDTVKIETFLCLEFNNLLLNGADRKFLTNSKTYILPVAGNPMLGFNTYILVATAVIFKITNKTDEPIEFDINHSQISVGTYQGRGVQPGTPFNGAATSVQAPVMIFPKATKEVNLWRTDLKFFNGSYYQGQELIPPKWLPLFDVVADKNLLGDMILCLDKKYITFTPKAVIPSNGLKWIKR